MAGEQRGGGNGEAGAGSERHGQRADAGGCQTGNDGIAERSALPRCKARLGALCSGGPVVRPMTSPALSCSYIKSEAVLKIARYLDFPFPPLSSLGFVAPGFLRDSFYDLVANNRYSILGKRDNCRISDNNFKERFID
eukprot:SM000086S23059  [mRNA]  locus=s86:292327:293229:- [translate_table: standard]